MHKISPPKFDAGLLSCGVWLLL